MEENRIIIAPFEYKNNTIKGRNVEEIKELPLRVANTDEVKKILKLKDEVSKEMGVKNESEAIYKKKGREFRSRLNSKLQYIMNILYCFEGVHIIKNDDKISEYVDSNSAKIELNKRIIEHHTTSFEKDYEKYSIRHWENDVRNHTCFVETQVALLNSTVNILGEDIKEEVEDVKNRLSDGEYVKFIPKYKNMKRYTEDDYNNYEEYELRISEYDNILDKILNL